MGKRSQLNLERVKLKLNLLGIQGFDPETRTSNKWLEWITNISQSTCARCMNLNGRVIDINDINFEYPPLHMRCRCEIERMLAIIAGTATIDGNLGADLWMIAFNELPAKYVSKSKAIRSGWKNWLGSLDEVLPGKLIGGGIYRNDNKKLPDAPNRIWREADINYTEGYRNKHRLLYSNDGLIFITYDHYESFYYELVF